MKNNLKSKLDMVRFAALMERCTTPLLEDGVNNEEGDYEMNAKHTPGPWHSCLAPRGHNWVIVGPNDEAVGAAGTEVNATLMAAAPALLKALEMIASAHTTDEFARRCAYAAIEEATK